MTAIHHRPWWQSGVFYNLYVRSFKDSDGDGLGDLGGVIEKLDYLAGTLGVDALWIAAALDSPWADFGYDVSDYTAFHPVFGDLEIFDELVRQAHRRGLRIILDYVPNHSSDQHPWFLEARASRQSPKRDWYIWADAKPDGSPPNNWLSVFGGSAWEWDEATGQYYMHSFLKEQPDLNWRSPALKEAMFGVARFWLERGVDAFRIDCAHHIMKDPQMRDNPPNPAAQDTAYKPLGEYDSQVHLYDREHADAHLIWREFRQLLDAYGDERNRAAFGEIHIFEWPRWAEYYGENLDELHMPFNLGLVGIEWNPHQIRAVVDAIEAAISPGAWPNYMLGNFDEHRVASRYGAAEARIAAMLLLTLRGTPMLCYGEEIGMTNVPIPPELEQDPFGLRVPGLGRDPERTPMQWSSETHAGFSAPETLKLWLPIAPDYRKVNVDHQLQEPHSILNLYRQLLAYRKESPALQHGNYQPQDGVPEACYVYARHSEEQHLLVALNFSGLPQELPLPTLGSGQIILSTYLDRAETASLNRLALRAHEGIIIELD